MVPGGAEDRAEPERKEEDGGDAAEAGQDREPVPFPSSVQPDQDMRQSADGQQERYAYHFADNTAIVRVKLF